MTCQRGLEKKAMAEMTQLCEEVNLPIPAPGELSSIPPTSLLKGFTRWAY